MKHKANGMDKLDRFVQKRAQISTRINSQAKFTRLTSTESCQLQGVDKEVAIEDMKRELESKRREKLVLQTQR